MSERPNLERAVLDLMEFCIAAGRSRDNLEQAFYDAAAADLEPKVRALVEAARDAMSDLHGILDEKSLWPDMAKYESQAYLHYQALRAALAQFKEEE